MSSTPMNSGDALDIALHDFALRLIRVAIDVTLAACATRQYDSNGRSLLALATDAYCMCSVMPELGTGAVSQEARTCARIRTLKLLHTALAMLERTGADCSAVYFRRELDWIVAQHPALTEADVKGAPQ